MDRTRMDIHKVIGSYYRTDTYDCIYGLLQTLTALLREKDEAYMCCLPLRVTIV